MSGLIELLQKSNEFKENNKSFIIIGGNCIITYG